MTKKQFSDYIHGAAPIAGQLGLTHVTDCAYLGGLIASGKLEPRDCKVYGEPLVYLFYGRPAYRSNWDEGTTTAIGYARICLILRDEVAAMAHRILPFDSGGFPHYSSALHHSLTREDFEVDPKDHPLKIVGAFYDSLESYWEVKPKHAPSFPITQNVIQSYYDLISGGLKEEFDDRCGAIEVQVAEAIPLKDRIVALIAPNQTFEDDAVKQLLAESGAEARGYRLTRMFNPKEVSGQLLSEVARFLEDQSWL
jgi:hypothetical protein